MGLGHIRVQLYQELQGASITFEYKSFRPLYQGRRVEELQLVACKSRACVFGTQNGCRESS